MRRPVTTAGGIGGQRRTAWMTLEFGVRYVGHGWNTAVGVAADLQIAAAMPNTEVVEFIGASAYVDGRLTQRFRLDGEGCLEIPMSPGIGVALDPEKVARYSPAWRRLFEIEARSEPGGARSARLASRARGPKGLSDAATGSSPASGRPSVARMRAHAAAGGYQAADGRSRIRS